MEGEGEGEGPHCGRAARCGLASRAPLALELHGLDARLDWTGLDWTWLGFTEQSCAGAQRQPLLQPLLQPSGGLSHVA